jgi:arylsulfatase A-like enzyme
MQLAAWVPFYWAPGYDPRQIQPHPGPSHFNLRLRPMYRPKRLSILLILSAAGILLRSAPAAQSSQPGAADVLRPKHVILVSMDTVGANYVSGYSLAHSTPNLQRMLQEGGVVFRDFYGASNYTLPSHMGMFTGRDAAEHGVQHPKARLSDQIPTLAEVFQKANYRTRGWHEGAYVAASFGFDKGFESYTENPRVSMVREGLPQVLDWIKARKDEPYFLFFHTYAAHAPYGGYERYHLEHPERKLPNPKRLQLLRDQVGKDKKQSPKRREIVQRQNALINYFLEPNDAPIGFDFRVGSEFPGSRHFKMDIAQMKRSYRQRIREVDHAIGQMRATLEQLGEWEHTLLVVTSDHGEAFFEHGFERHDFLPFNEVIKVPLIISYPALLKGRASREITGLAWHLDLMPTILSLAGLEAPANLTGMDLAPILSGSGNVPKERSIFPAILRSASAPQLGLKRVMLEEHMKWIEGHSFYGAKDGLLFQTTHDPEETSNLREGFPKEFARMQRAAEAYSKSLVQIAPTYPADGNLELSDEEQSELQALGYLDADEDEDE